MKRNKNMRTLVVFVLIASFIVNVSGNVLAQYGSVSGGALLRTFGAMLTTSTDATLNKTAYTTKKTPVAFSEEYGAQTAAAQTAETTVARLASQTRTQLVSSTPASYHVVVTAYSSTVEQTDSTPFITASGSYVRDGIVAANFLPIGAQITMPDLYGDKVFVVEDRMNRRYSDRVDIWMPSQNEAQQFGKRYVRIEVL